MKPLNILLAERAELIKYVIYNSSNSPNIEVLLPTNVNNFDMLDVSEVDVSGILENLKETSHGAKAIVDLTDCRVLRGSSLSIGTNLSASGCEPDEEIEVRSILSNQSGNSDAVGYNNSDDLSETMYQRGGNIFNRGWYEYIGKNSSVGLPDFASGSASQYAAALNIEDCNISPSIAHRISPRATQETNGGDEFNKTVNSETDTSSIGVDGSRAVTSSATDPEGFCVRIRPSAVMSHNFPQTPPKPIWMKLESPNTELFEPLDSNLQLTKLILYDFALMVCKLRVPPVSEQRRDKTAILNIKRLDDALSLFRSALRITEKEHRQAVIALLPSQVLETVSDVSGTIDAIVAGDEDLLHVQIRDTIRKLVMPTKTFLATQVNSNSRSYNCDDLGEELDDAISALKLRHSTMMKTRAAGLFAESFHLFPLSIRAMIFAGMLSTTCKLVPIDCALDISLEKLSPLLKLAKKELRISDAVAPLCHVHAAIIANKRQMDDDATTHNTDLIDDDNSTEKGNEVASQVQFMYTLTNALIDLQNFSLVHVSPRGKGHVSPSTPNITEENDVPYRDYVLEISLQFSLLPLVVMLETLNDETLLWSLGDLMITVCKACCKAGVIKRALLVSRATLSYYNNKIRESGGGRHNIAAGHIDYYEDHDEVISSILGEILCAPMYRQLVDLATVSQLSKIVSSIADAHRWVLGYAVRLGHSVPEAPALPLEAVIRILSHILYRRWQHLVHGHAQVPDEFTKVIQVVFEFIRATQGVTIKVACDPSSRLFPPSSWIASCKAAKDDVGCRSSVKQCTYQAFLSDKVVEVTNKAIEESFGWLSPLFDLHMKVVIKIVNKEFESIVDRVYWDGSGVGVCPAVSDVFSLFCTQVSSLRHSFIPAPHVIFVQYLSTTLNQLDAYTAKVPGSVNIGHWGKVSLLDYQRDENITLPPQAFSNKFIMKWKFAVAKMEKFGPLVLNIQENAFVYRLNTLAAVQDETIKFVRTVGELYESLRSVTGCLSMEVEMQTFNEELRSTDSVTNRAIDDVCESIALLCVLGLKSTFFHKIYVTDMKKYKARKQISHVVAENNHLTDLYPEVRVSDAIDVLDNRLTILLSNINNVIYHSKILSYCKLYTVAFLTEVILSDVSGQSLVKNTLFGTTDRYFFPSRSDALLRDLKELTEYFDNTAVSGDYVTTPEVELLVSSVKYVFEVLMSKETPDLVRMYETGVKLDVVERGDGPSYLYIVMCILNHRKDKIAKKFVEKYK